MLTEIQWWGGLLFIWGALALWTQLHFFGEHRWFNILSACTFALIGLSFALYFYELQQPVLRYGFVLATAAAALGVVAFLLSMAFGFDEDDEAPSTETVGDEDE